MIDKIKKFFGFNTKESRGVKHAKGGLVQRSMIDILTLVKIHIQESVNTESYYSGGICGVLDDLLWGDKISDDEHLAADAYIIRWFKEDSDRPYFDEDVEVYRTDIEPFVHGAHYFWNSQDYQARLDWLSEEITILKTADYIMNTDINTK